MDLHSSIEGATISTTRLPGSRKGRLSRRLLAWVSSLAFRKAQVLGSPSFPGPHVFAANHPTTLDPLLLQFAAKRRLSMLVLDAVFRVPLVGRLLAAAKHIPVSAGAGQRSVEEAVAALASGLSVGIFPEGRISPEEGLASLRTGAVRIAAAAGVPIVPVGIWQDPDESLTVNTKVGGIQALGRYNLGGRCVIAFGQPLDFGLAAEDRQGVKAATALLEAEIGRLAARCETVGLRLKRARNFWLGSWGSSLLPCEA